jgi:phenylacetate-CoA ligase
VLKKSIVMRNYPRVIRYFFDCLQRSKWNKSKIEEYQNKKIRKVIKNAYENVPFYKKLLDEANIDPSTIKTKKDLNKIPVVRKNKMKQVDPNSLISTKFNVMNLKKLQTGGSSGEPFSFYLSREEEDWRQAISLRPNFLCNQRPWHQWVTIIDGEYASGITYYRNKIKIFPQTMVSAIWNVKDQLKAVQRLKPDILDGFSSSLWLLAREVDSQKINNIKPKIIFGTGELITTSSRQYLEKVFNAPYCDQFGCMELNRTAWECKEHTGYHMDIDSTIMQFIDKNGEEVAFGEKGEIVYTSLFSYSMPFIRYGIGDVGIPTDVECSCGVTLPLMKMVEGRSNSFIIFPTGEIVSPWVIIEHLKAFQLTKEIDKYRVIQRSKNLIEINIKKNENVIDENKIATFLITNLRDGLQNIEKINLSDVEIKVNFVEELKTTKRGKQNVIQSLVES